MRIKETKFSFFNFLMAEHVEGKDAAFAYWTRWQFTVCAAVVAVPAAIAAFAILRSEPDPLHSSDLWKSCWRRIHPLWLLAYRALVCVAMSYIMLQMLLYRGPSVFFFYTEWSFTLVIIYFVIGTIISTHGCWNYSRGYVDENEEVLKRLLERDFEANLPAVLMSRTNENNNAIKLQNYHEEGENLQIAGFWGYTMQIVYQTCGGAVLLTDIIFWGFLVLLLPSDYFKLNPVTGCTHSLNLLFLLVDAAFNRLRFPFFRMAYFILWSFSYVVFQWVLHACRGIQWWPYPFLDLSIPSAPAWYFVVALLHLPCYGFYYVVVRAKNSAFSKCFPHSYVRSY